MINKKDSNSLLDQANIRKIESEIKKIEEEKLKVELERKELEDKLNTPWYKKSRFYQTILCGIVAIPLIWFYIKEFTIPFMRSENIKLTLENEKIRSELDNKKQSVDSLQIEYESKLKQLRTESSNQISQYISQIKKLQKRHAQGDSIRKELETEIDNVIANLPLTTNQQKKLTSIADVYCFFQNWTNGM